MVSEAPDPLQRLRKMAETDPQVAAIFPDETVTAAISEPGLLLPEKISRLLAGYADRPAMGSRVYERRQQDGRTVRHFLPSYSTITYGEVARRVEAVASAWQHHPQHRVAPGEFAAFISFVSAEMVAVDLACAYARVIAVPLQANLPDADMMEVFADTEPAVLVASMENLELTADYALRVRSVRSLVVIDADERVDDERERIEAVRARMREEGDRIAVATFDELVEYGARFEWQHLPPPPEGRDAMMLLVYTSGSTGTPKGAMMQDANLSELFTYRYALPAIQLAYAPLNHFLGRNIVYCTMGKGGTVYFTLKSDMSTLFEDARLARPTSMLMMPRIVDIIYQQYRSEVQRRVAAGGERDQAEEDVRREMSKTVLGDRMVAGGVGGAPTSPEVRDFIGRCLGIVLSDGYSCTEGSSVGLVGGGRLMRDVVTDYKLVDVPELGYYSTDKPHPRGELLLRSRLVFKGYFKRPEATAEVLDEDGWLHTGDIFEERGPDQLTWLDRRNTVIKLSQAEYVAIGPLEATFVGNSKLIRQIFVYGNSRRSCLLAVVVPDLGVARVRLGRDPTPEDLRRMALADLQEVARKAGLKNFEVPRDVVIETEPFTHENGLLSPILKPLRPRLRDRYKDALERLYRDMDRQQETELAALRGNADNLPVVERVAGALRASLGLAEVDPHGGETFTDLGGDSLGAASFALLLEDLFDVTVPVGVILGPTASAERLARFIDNACEGAGDAPTFASVHGEHAAKVRRGDLALDAFFDEDFLSRAGAAAPVASPSRTVLVTGVTGFLGRFLCLEWLEAVGRENGKVIALVRAADEDAARRRLGETFAGPDPDLTDRYRALADNRLELVAGDLAEPRLGLDRASWERLAETVDHIVHPGSLVNHILPYRSLFEPNVRGTAELIRLALTTRRKRFDYVSTFGVAKMSERLLASSEDCDVRTCLEEVQLTDGYAVGYAISKWASEVLLREANEQFGLAVTVFRPDMIMPHSRYRGQVNVPDMLSRLLLGVATTGLAPASFYEPGVGGARARTHFDGLPVDFLAWAIQRLGAQADPGYRTFNTISSHLEDGVSLDSFVEWIESAGYRVDRIPDHADWLERFSTSLRNMPEEQRSHSALPTLGFVDRPHAADAPKVHNEAFVAAVRALPGGREVPGISEQYMHKYLEDLQLLGLMPRPARALEASP